MNLQTVIPQDVPGIAPVLVNSANYAIALESEWRAGASETPQPILSDSKGKSRKPRQSKSSDDKKAKAQDEARRAHLQEWEQAFVDYCWEQYDAWRFYADTAEIDCEHAVKMALLQLDTWKQRQLKEHKGSEQEAAIAKAWTVEGYYESDALPSLDDTEGLLSKTLNEFLRAHLGKAVAEQEHDAMMELRSFAAGNRGEMSRHRLRQWMKHWLSPKPVLREWMAEQNITIEDVITYIETQPRKREAA